MKVKIEFDTGNAAFGDDWEHETRHACDQAWGKLYALWAAGGGYGDTASLYDTNGNQIGTVTVEQEPKT